MAKADGTAMNTGKVRIMPTPKKDPIGLIRSRPDDPSYDEIMRERAFHVMYH